MPIIRAGVVGSPAKHSLSPLIHGAWLKAAGIAGEYALFDIPADGLEAFLHRAPAEGLRGVNVTLPFKEQALIAADTTSEAAQLAGAANLLIFEDGGIRAGNTDGVGLIHALGVQAPGLDYIHRPVVLMGAGGAAKGAAAALANAGCHEIRIVNRTPARAHQLAVELMLDFDTDVMHWDFDSALEGAGLLINAATAGMGGQDDRKLDLSPAGGDLVVMDMVYAPLVTPLLAAAKARGLRTVDGLEMLIGQAIPSFEAFFGQKPPAGVDVRALALAELERRA